VEEISKYNLDFAGVPDETESEPNQEANLHFSVLQIFGNDF
jgi:hypothetical protein